MEALKAAEFHTRLLSGQPCPPCQPRQHQSASLPYRQVTRQIRTIDPPRAYCSLEWSSGKRRHGVRQGAVADNKAGVAAAEEEGGVSPVADEDFGEVEKVLASRVVDGKSEYLVRWTDDFGDSWEPAENIAEDVKAEYEAPWWQAARKAEVEKLQNLLMEDGRDVNAIDENQRTALHFVSGLGNEKAVNLLAECGADVHAQDKDGYTALHIAAGYVHTTVVKALLDLGADPEAADKNGRTVLELAQELLGKLPASNPMAFGRRLALNEVVKMLDDAIFEDVEVEQVLDRRVVGESDVEYLVRWSDNSEESWEPAANIAEDLIKDYEAGLEYGEVEKILEKRKRKGKVEYLVKWVDSEEKTWEPAKNVAEEVVQGFEATLQAAEPKSEVAVENGTA